MSPAEFHFLRPLWLWLLVPLALLVWRLWRSGDDSDAWRGLVDPHLLPRLLVDADGGTRRLPMVLLGLGWVLLVLALAGPTWERLPQPVYQVQAYRVLALDISPSMNATDVSPSRLAHARFELLDLLRKATEGQTALIAYGAEPYVVSPLTNDVETIAAQVPALETDLLPVQGARRTDLALEWAGRLLSRAGAPDGEVFLITDRLEHPAAAAEAARKLRAKGYLVSVLGVGTTKGAPIPSDNGGFRKDERGAILLPKLDSDMLRTLAEAGGGRYATAGAGDRDIETLMPATRSPATQGQEQQDMKTDQWREQGPWLLLALLPLVALAFRRGWLSPLLVLVVLMPTPDAQALGWEELWSRPDQRAMRRLEAGEPSAAAALFEQPDWRAAAQYQAGEYDRALRLLQGRDRPDAAYNRGNALARMGRLEDALAAYDQALTADPDDADARHNRELVQGLIERRRAEQRSTPESQSQSGSGDQRDQQNQQGQQGESPSKGDQQAGSPEAQDGRNGKGGESEGQESQAQQQSGESASGEQQPGGLSKDSAGEPLQAAQAQSTEPDADTRPESEPADGAGESRDQEQRQAQAASDESQADAHPEKSPIGTTPEGSKVGEEQSGGLAKQEPAHSTEPGIGDLLGGNEAAPGTPGEDRTAGVDPEDLQATEQMLRRVEDDPAGLLRQRFLLQHLRRSGQLP